MKKKILKTLVGAASFALLLSSCSLMPGMSQPGQDNNQNDPVTNDNRGSALLTGNGRPSASLGEVGDLYLDLSTYDLYVKTDFGWSINGTLKGEQGEPGADGKDGQDGHDGRDGVDGKDGQDGKDGVDGKDGQDGQDGKDGQDGQDGKDGQDGQDADLTDIGFNFFAVNDNEYSVSAGTYKYYQGEVTIPTEFNGKPVTAISGDGFKDSSITSVIIPEGITSIGEHAFDGCANLGSVNLPSTLTTIGSRAFVNCSSLSTINLDNVTSIGEWAFGGCTNLRTVNLSANIYNIGQGAFHDCSRLATINYAGSQNNWQYIATGDYWFLGTRITSIMCAGGSFNINQYNEEVMVSLDSDYHLVGGYDANNWAPNASNKMNAASIRQIYNINSELGSKLSEKNIKHLYMRQIQIGAIPQTWTSKTLYKNKVREVNGDLTFRVSESTYNPQEDLYTEQRYIPDNGNFNGRNRAEALTSNIFIPSYQSDLDENGFCWNNSCVMNVQDGTYIFVMAEYNTDQWSGNPQFGFGLLVISGGDMITNDPLDDEDPSVTKEYTGVYLNEDGTEFARSGGNSLAELYAYNKHLPEKAAEGNTQYGFREWELVSNIDNVVTFKPAFDGCTRGLQFEGNSVYQYVGMTQDVVIPSVWEGKQITSISDRAFQSTDITSVVIPNSITRIQSQAFAACKRLESIVIPDSVTTIDYRAFNGCTYLKDVTLSNNLTSLSSGIFQDCQNLESIVIPNKVTNIESEAFRECRKLSSINLPNALTYISSWVFYNCQALTSIVIPDGVKTIGDYCFYYCNNLADVKLGNSLENIYSCAFQSCTKLESISLPDSVTYIGNNAFNNCNNLVVYMTLEYKPKSFDQNWNGNSTVIYGYKETRVIDGCTYVLSQREDYKFAKLIDFDVNTLESFDCSADIDGYVVNDVNTNLFRENKVIKSVVLPSSVKSISREMFYNCSNLESVVIPEGVESINERAFYGCENLASIQLPSTLSGNIGYEAFYNCKSLESITFGDGITSIDSSAFQNCVSLVSITLPNALTRLSSSVFSGCTSLETIVIPEGITTIESGTFNNCISLVSVTLPSNLENIYDSAFANCSSLESFTFGSKIKNINSYAFSYCSSLKEIDLRNTSIEYLGWEVFNGCSSVVSVYLPDTLKRMEWGALGNMTSLVNIRIGASIEYVNHNNLSNSPNLSYNVLNGLRYIGNEENPYIALVGRENNYTDGAIADSCKIIGFGDSNQSALSWLYNNERIIILPESVTTIARYGLYGVQASILVIGSNVSNIQECAFESCTIGCIFYQGTKADWKKVLVENNGNSNLIGATRYYYSETEPTEEGNFWHYVDGVPTAW